MASSGSKRIQMSSDGYNKTYYNNHLAKYFGAYYNFDKGKVHDSIQLLLRLEHKDSLFVVKRDTFGNNSKAKKVKLSKEELKENDLQLQ